jgi:hypothetical protein
MYFSQMKITKKQIKEIKSGNHATLMDCLEFLLDTYEEDKFDNGYQSCLSDLSVRAHSLSLEITKAAEKKGKKAGKKGYYLLDSDEVAQIIEEYFRNAIKTEKDGR